MRVVLAEDGTIERGSLERLLKYAGLVVVGEGSRWDALAELVSSKTPDILIVALGSDPRFFDGMRSLGASVPSVVVANELPAQLGEQIAHAGAFGVVPFSAGPDALAAVTMLALQRAGDFNSIRKEATDLRDQLETRKLVERAKGILMRRLSLSEPDAFRRLQKASQDENKRMRDIAESIVHAEKVFGGKDQQAPPAGEHRAAQ
jgi:response regulator NasT